MVVKSSPPDIAQLPLPIDTWTQPFWDAAERSQLVMPCCESCHAWRWPPSPFCPKCRSQEVEWRPAGPARLYSFTIVRQPGRTPEDPLTIIIPGLVEFPEAGGMRFMAAIVDTAVEQVRIGAPLTVGWRPKEGTNVPVFSIR